MYSQQKESFMVLMYVLQFYALKDSVLLLVQKYLLTELLPTRPRRFHLMTIYVREDQFLLLLKKRQLLFEE
jgi:hypothetical protein